MKRDVSDLIQALIKDREAKDASSPFASMGALLTANGERNFFLHFCFATNNWLCFDCIQAQEDNHWIEIPVVMQ